MLSIVAQIFLGWLLADFLTGIAHWFEDRVMKPTWPIIGPAIARPNQQHHENPTAFIENSFLRRNWSTWAATAIVALPLLAACGFSLLLVTAIIGGASAAQIHYLTHKPGAQSKWLKAAQTTGAIQSRRGHYQHHRPPQDGSYCALTDWLNPWLDAAGFWRAADRIFKITDKEQA